MLRVRPVLFAVKASASLIPCRICRLKRSRLPNTFRRILFSCRRRTCFCKACKNSPIRNDTSSSGRRQFSVEKANTVRYCTPSLAQCFTIFSNASKPRLCPITRGRKRFFAQRPLPSIITATCFGTEVCSKMVCVLLFISAFRSAAVQRSSETPRTRV